MSGNDLPQWTPYTYDQFTSWVAGADSSDPYNQSTVPLAARDPVSVKPPYSIVALNHHGGATPFVPGLQIFPNVGSGLWPFPVYTPFHWQFIDYAVYFNVLKAVTVVSRPPAAWTNAAHRHGVRMLGLVMFQVEADNASLTDLTRPDKSGAYPRADLLWQIATYYGFDGWLFNIEIADMSAPNIGPFLQYMQSVKPPATDLTMALYGAIDASGTLDYANGMLTAQNLPLFENAQGRVSDLFLTDFRWCTEGNPQTSASNAGSRAGDVYSGIGLGKLSGCPGYTTCGIQPLLARASPWTSVFIYSPAEMYNGEMAAAIAPAPAPALAAVFEMDRIFWNGPGSTACDDSNADWSGFGSFVSPRTLITSLPFATRFNAGEGYNYWVDGEPLLSAGAVPFINWSDIGQQEALPTWQWATVPANTRGTPLTPSLCFEQSYNGGSCLQVSGVLDANNATELRMFAANVTLPQGAQISVISQGDPNMIKRLLIGLYFAGQDPVFQPMGGSLDANGWFTGILDLAEWAGSTLQAITFQFDWLEMAFPQYQLYIGGVILNVPQAPPQVPLTLQLTATNLTESFGCTGVTWTAPSQPLWYCDVSAASDGAGARFLGRTSSTECFVTNLTPPQDGTNITTFVVQPVLADGTACAPSTIVGQW